MAKQTRKPAARKPITSNPLFPAVVALWFGALFGLGSLAVRPSLIEDLVLRSRIDLIIPAAAPPLGVTARIMLALILAALGAIIGTVLARRLARPKTEVRERSRSVRVDEQPRGPAAVRRDAACTPVSIKDLDPAVPAPQADGVLPGRRRALAIDHEEQDFVPHDLAPLPGGDPQILDMAAYQAAAPALPPVAAPDPAPVAAAMPAPVAAPPAAAGDAEPRQMFQPLPPAAVPALAPETAAAHADGRQVFGMAQPDPQPEKPRQIFGMTVADDHVPQDFVREAGYRTTVFETETPSPLFDRRDAADAPTAVPDAAAVPPALAAAAGHEAAPAPVEPAMPVPASLPGALPPVEAAPALEAAPTFASAPEAAPAPPPAPAADPLPSPAGLGMTDLATRLAESMRRRRAARALSAAAPLAEPADLPTADLASANPAPADLAPAAGSPFAAAPVQDAVASPAELAPLPEPALVTAAAPDPAPLPAPLPLPASMPAPAVQADRLPNALRPLALDAFLEDDADLDLGLLPPRHIAFPPAATPVATPESAAPAAFGQPFAPPVSAPAAIQPDEPADEPAEDPAAEAGYGSLLGLTPRTGFVRIEVPEADAAAPEPVVIFPGHAPFASAPSAPAPTSEADTGPFRRFDSPAAAGHGQPVDSGAATPAIAPEDAEQALRSALASLQRISGAA